jgi:nucleoside-diphosphate-sugar epimerase
MGNVCLANFAPTTAERLRSGGHQFIVTGATGWLGRATLEMLAAALGGDFGSRVTAVGSREAELELAGGSPIRVYPLEGAAARFGSSPALLFHFAFLTKDKVSALSNEEYVARNRAISTTVRSWIAAGRVAGVMLPSSGAVYDALRQGNRDPDAVPYGALKLEDEELFRQACKAVGARLVIPRVFNLSGPFINKFDAYALSSIIVDALRGGPVRIRADVPVWRSYVYVPDLIEICVRWLLSGKQPDSVVFDTGTEDIVELQQLVQRVRQVLGSENMAIERPAIGGTHENRYVGDGSAMKQLSDALGYPLLGLDEQIRRTASYMAAVLSGVSR